MVHRPSLIVHLNNSWCGGSGSLVTVGESLSDAAKANLNVVGSQLLVRVDEMCAEQCRIIRERVAAYRDPALVTDDDLFAAGRDQMVFVLEVMGAGAPDTSVAGRVGRLRAEQGVPLADVMSAYRAGGQFLWDQILQAIDAAGLSRQELRAAASQAWQNQDIYTDAMAEGYREVVVEQLIHRDQERSALVGGLIDGRLPAGMTAGDAAHLLGLPESGCFVVVAIDSGPLDYRALRAAEKTLGDRGFASAWRVEPDMQVGVVALVMRSRLGELGEALRGLVVQRIGVSPVYDGYPPHGSALNYAKAALLAATGDEAVLAFDVNPYAIAAVTDPPTMERYCDLVLGGLGDIGAADRQLLVSTFQQWVTCDGSIPATAGAMFCHPNTVRYRLRRLKQLTGRDIARPRDIAELHLAIEADRRLNLS